MDPTARERFLAAQGLIGETAKLYLAGGLAAIPITSPLSPDRPGGNRAGKAPLPKEWQKKRQTVEDFEREAKRPRGVNLGIVCGTMSGIVCIDIDPKKGGMRWFVENESRLGNFVREVTGSGGLHLYFRYPAGVEALRGGTDAIAPGVDVPGQVVTWPSYHPAGGQYAIDNGLTLLDVPHEADELPAWIVEALKRPATKPADPAASTDYLDHPDNVARVREVLASFPEAVEGQGGDARTFQAACLGRDYGLSPEALFPLMQEYNRRCRPPWGEAELREKIQNAYRYGRGALGEKAPENDFRDTGEEPEPAPLSEEAREQQGAAMQEPKYYPKKPELSAALFLSRHPGRCLVKDDTIAWYFEERRSWDLISDAMLRSLVRADIEAVSPNAIEKLLPSNLRNIAEAIKTRLQDHHFRAEGDRWLDGRSGDFVGLDNGVLDVRTGKLLAHSPQWFAFSHLPFSHDPDAHCSEFHRFLESIWPGDKDAKDCLQLWLGYLMLSETSAQKFALLIGASRAGKGVLTRLIEKIIGHDGCASSTMTSLAGDFGLSPLIGKRVVFFHDAYKASGSLGEVALERLISIVGRDRQVVNRKNQGLITVALPARIVLVCNELPPFVNNRGALSNRMLVFPFSRSFAGREDLELEARLEGELPGIFNWALEGARRVSLGERLRQPTSAEGMFQELRRTMDPVLGFLEECVEFGDLDPWEEEAIAASWTVTVDSLYEEYKRWCQDAGHMAKAKNKFSMAFAALCPAAVDRKIARRGMGFVRVFTNLRLRAAKALSEFN